MLSIEEIVFQKTVPLNLVLTNQKPTQNQICSTSYLYLVLDTTHEFIVHHTVICPVLLIITLGFHVINP